MISPHMKEPKLAKLTRSIIKITITHMAIRENSVTSSNMLLKNRNNMRHCFVSDRIYESYFCFSAEHAKHPSNCDVVA